MRISDSTPERAADECAIPGMALCGVMVTLTTHVERMLALSGGPARSEKDAAAVLGLKGSTFPARKALDQFAEKHKRAALNLMAGLASIVTDRVRKLTDELVATEA